MVILSSFFNNSSFNQIRCITFILELIIISINVCYITLLFIDTVCVGKIGLFNKHYDHL